MSTGEWIGLKATLHAVDHREFVCSECLNKYNNRADSDQMTEAMRKVKACRDESPNVIHSIRRELNFTSCIGNFVSPGYFPWIEMHNNYERGMLPYPGSLSEQPSKVMDIFRVIDAHRRATMKEESDKAKAKNARGTPPRGR